MNRVCRACGVDKGLEDFHNHPTCKFGKLYVCKSCVKAQSKARYAKDTSPAKSRAKSWAIANPERRIEIRRRSEAKNREKNRARKAEASRRRYAADLEEGRRKSREHARDYRLRKPEIMSAISKRTREKKRRIDPAGVALASRQTTARRRAKLRLVASEPVNYADIAKRDKGRCRWCRKAVKRGGRHFDHVIPVSKGGPHLMENIVLSCAACNLSKSAKVFTLF